MLLKEKRDRRCGIESKRMFRHHQPPLVKLKEKLAALASKVVSNKIGFSWAIQHLTAWVLWPPSVPPLKDTRRSRRRTPFHTMCLGPLADKWIRPTEVTWRPRPFISQVYYTQGGVEHGNHSFHPSRTSPQVERQTHT